MQRATQLRLVCLFLVCLLLVPVAVAAVQHDSPTASASELRQTATDVTFITTQGGSTELYEHAGKLVAVHTDTRRTIWHHDDYRRYMDVDPLDSDRVLVVAGERTGDDSFRRIAVVLNWRTGEEVRKFQVPWDTHDIDALGDGRFAVADKANHTAYVVNASDGTVTWRYDFRTDFNASDGDDPVEGDWTHLNDIDVHRDGNAVLLSPRNFDRVLLLNRSTNDIVWTLGKEDAHDVLHEQHNPVVLQWDPVTVLVADSENDRVVEYRRTESGDWELTWSYSTGLRWPRDADRLPNGNTLITDTLNDRVIEVTPGREVVWEFPIERSPYDVERLQYGDEPAGPPMTQFDDQFASPERPSETTLPGTVVRLESSYNRLYQLVGAWLLPGFAGPGEFGFVLLAAGIVVGWGVVEVVVRLPVERMARRVTGPDLGGASLAFGALAVVLGSLLLWIVVAERALTGVYVATAVLLANVGYERLRPALVDQETTATERLDAALRLGLLGGSVAVGGLLLYSQVTADGRVLLYGGLGIAVVATALHLVEA
jgi:hypothetical protein